MKKLFLFLVFASAMTNLFAINYYWVGGVGTSGSPKDWNTGSNWSTSTGGTPGSVVPGSGDVAIFDGATGNSSPFVNIAGYNIAIAELQIVPISTATANNVVSFVGTATSFSISGNITFNVVKPSTTQYNGQITDYGNNTISVSGNIATNMATSTTLVNLSSTNSNLTAGRIALIGSTPTIGANATGGNINLQNLDISGTTTATFNSSANALGINGNLNIQTGGKLSITKTLVLNNLTPTGSNPFNSPGTISGGGYITGSTTTQISITGTLPASYTSSNLQGIGTVNFDPTTVATCTINSMSMSRANSGITIGTCLNSLLTLQGGFTITAGTIDDGGNILRCGGSTILTTGGATATIKGTGKIQCNRANTSQILCTAGGTFAVGNLEIMNANTGVYYTLGANTNLTINGTLTLSTPTTKTSGIDASGATLTFQNSNTPIVVNTIGTGVNKIKTDASTNLKFGSNGNTGGTAFTIPTDVFLTAPSLASFTINRDNAITLGNQSITAASLSLTKGLIALGANNLTVGTTLTGGSSSSYIVTDGAGKLTLPAASGVNTLIPIGASASSYDPVSVNPASATTFAASVSSTLSGSAASGVSYDGKEWNLSSTSPSATAVSFTPSAITATGAYPIIGNYLSGAYTNSTASLNAGAYTATFSSFGPFVTGTSDVATALKGTATQISNVYSTNKGIVIDNANGKFVAVYTITGERVYASLMQSNLSTLSVEKGVYIVSLDNVKTKVVIK